MSTLPRPSGKELVRALERAGFLRHVSEEATISCGSCGYLRHPDGRATVIPLRTRTLGLGLLAVAIHSSMMTSTLAKVS